MEREHALYVLIVDYDPIHSRIAFHNLLEKFPGVQFGIARNGNQALSMIRQRLPDLVITDLQMPGLNGFALLRRLRSTPETIGVPVMVLGGVRDYESVRLAVTLGADDFIAKPVDFHVLSKRISQLITKRKSGIPLRENHRSYKRREVHVTVDIQIPVTGVRVDRFTIVCPMQVRSSATVEVGVTRLFDAMRLPGAVEAIVCVPSNCRETKGGYLVDLLSAEFPDRYAREAEKIETVAGMASRILGIGQRPVTVGLTTLASDLSGGGVLLESPWSFPESTGLRISMKKLFNAIELRTSDTLVTCIVRHSPLDTRPYRCGVEFTDLDPFVKMQIMNWCVSDLPEVTPI